MKHGVKEVIEDSVLGELFCGTFENKNAEGDAKDRNLTCDISKGNIKLWGPCNLEFN